MEGSGPRLSRVFSRYGIGPAPSATVFNGPVRKWKRKWVRVRSEQSNNNKKKEDNAVAGKRNQSHQQEAPSLLLLLRRWTPLNNSGDSSEPPSNRKFRYTPVIVLEEKRKEDVQRLSDDAKRIKMKQDRTEMRMTIDMPFEKLHFNDPEMKECSEDQAYFDDLDLQL